MIKTIVGNKNNRRGASRLVFSSKTKLLATIQCKNRKRTRWSVYVGPVAPKANFRDNDIIPRAVVVHEMEPQLDGF